MNFNPKVIASAAMATLAGGLMGAAGYLVSNPNPDSTKAVLIGLGAGFLTGAASAASGWLKSQGNWSA